MCSSDPATRHRSGRITARSAAALYLALLGASTVAWASEYPPPPGPYPFEPMPPLVSPAAAGEVAAPARDTQTPARDQATTLFGAAAPAARQPAQTQQPYRPYPGYAPRLGAPPAYPTRAAPVAPRPQAARPAPTQPAPAALAPQRAPADQAETAGAVEGAARFRPPGVGE
jgi:hypothetical protein